MRNEIFVNSDCCGTGSQLPSHLIQPKWIEMATGMTFFGEPLDKLSRDELMAVIGYLASQVEDEKRRHQSTLGVLNSLNPVSW